MMADAKNMERGRGHVSSPGRRLTPRRGEFIQRGDVKWIDKNRDSFLIRHDDGSTADGNKLRMRNCQRAAITEPP